MKSVFLIAIVAVAMIGVMVPSVFADYSEPEISLEIYLDTTQCKLNWTENCLEISVQGIIPYDAQMSFTLIDPNGKINSTWECQGLRGDTNDKPCSYHRDIVGILEDGRQTKDGVTVNQFITGGVSPQIFGAFDSDEWILKICAPEHDLCVEQKFEIKIEYKIIEWNVLKELHQNNFPNYESDYLKKLEQPIRNNLLQHSSDAKTDHFGIELLNKFETCRHNYDSNGCDLRTSEEFVIQFLNDEAKWYIQTAREALEVAENEIAISSMTTDEKVDSVYFLRNMVNDYEVRVNQIKISQISTIEGSYADYTQYQQEEIELENERKVIEKELELIKKEIEAKSELQVKPIVESITGGIASFVDQTKDPQHYIDRYNNEPAYKQWFDDNYSQYSSIYQAVGMEKTAVEPILEPVVEPIVEQKIISNSEREQMMSLMYQGLAIANVDFNKSLEYLKKATQIDLTNLEVQQAYDRIYDSKQTTTTQISNLNEKIKNNPEQNKDKADDLRNKGFALIKMGNYDDALTTCQESLKIIPNYSSLSCVQKSIVFKEDWNEYLKQVELYPGLNRQANDPYGDTRGTDFGTIRAYYNLQDYDTALKMINTALTFENDMTKFNLHIYKNVVLEKMNAKPTNNDIMVDDFFMAAIFFTLHDWEKAIYYIEKLETESPERLYASDSRSPLLDSKIIANYYLEKNSNVQLTSDVKSTTQFTPEPTVRDYSMPNCGPGTESVNGICEVIQTAEKSSGGGCLIATATYGSELSPQVQQLRELRDNQLLNTESGKQFMSTFNDIYYSFSPIVADYERENPLFKEAVKLAITPMISSLSLMENAESESEVLSMGISVIMLNLGMYLAVPAIVIVGIRKTVNS